MVVFRRCLLATVAVAVLTFAAFAGGVLVGNERGIPFVGWEEGWFVGIYHGDSPFDLEPAHCTMTPVLRGEDVTDYRASFVADPFMVRDNDMWYLFVEVMNPDEKQGDIGLATSADGYNWDWHSIVLNESFHLSYPQVFRYQDDWYMIPEAHEVNAVRLYKAEEFPTKWTPVQDLIEGPYYDSTILHWKDHWYIFTGEKYSISRLWVAEDLFGPWTEHPASPLHFNDDEHYRCGGRMIVYDGKPIRFNQDGRGRYGNRVRAFEITNLSPTEYEEQRVSDKPLLVGTGDHIGWNSELMHHIDLHQLPDGSWIAAVDGFGRLRGYGFRY